MDRSMLRLRLGLLPLPLLLRMRTGIENLIDDSQADTNADTVCESIQYLYKYTKSFDATELCGIRHKAARSTRPLQLGPKTFELMRESFVQQRRNDEQETEKAPFLVVRKVRDAILHETFKPGDRLPEAELAEMFEVSRSPVREALLALEKEGTVMMEPYIGATVKPLSPEDTLDIAELRLPLITLAAKMAHRHLSPADFDLASGLAKQATRSKSAKEHFEYNRRFWDIIFEKTQRPILWEVFRQLDDRMTRYYPLLLELYPTPESRPRQHEALIEIYRKGQIAEALRAFFDVTAAVTAKAPG
jgi:DNA-binding GntR family transcriptional regulator